MKKRILSALLALVLAIACFTGCQNNGDSDTDNSGARITVEGNQFVVNGSEIWINGVNTPWDNWDDFGGSMDGVFWKNEFEKLHNAGINATRIWITCSGNVGINIDEDGYVSGATDSHWSSLDLLFSLAEQYHIYVMATLISFDHFKESNSNHMRWRSMVQDSDKIDSYVDNYLVPFLERYGDNDYLWSIDLCNEPDWVIENQECGRLSWKDMGNYFARCAAAIHRNSDVLVTVGFGMIKYCSEKYNGDYGSAKYLQSQYSNAYAYLDFNSVHYYEWQAPWYSNPFDASPADFGLDDSMPSLLGEMPAVAMVGENSSSPVRDLTQCYTDLYEHGWNGIMPWTANGVDSCGNMTNIEPAATAILEKIEDKIFPLNDRELSVE